MCSSPALIPHAAYARAAPPLVRATSCLGPSRPHHRPITSFAHWRNKKSLLVFLLSLALVAGMAARAFTLSEPDQYICTRDPCEQEIGTFYDNRASDNPDEPRYDAITPHSPVFVAHTGIAAARRCAPTPPLRSMLTRGRTGTYRKQVSDRSSAVQLQRPEVQRLPAV